MKSAVSIAVAMALLMSATARVERARLLTDAEGNTLVEADELERQALEEEFGTTGNEGEKKKAPQKRERTDASVGVQRATSEQSRVTGTELLGGNMWGTGAVAADELRSIYGKPKAPSWDLTAMLNPNSKQAELSRKVMSVMELKSPKDYWLYFKETYESNELDDFDRRFITSVSPDDPVPATEPAFMRFALTRGPFFTEWEEFMKFKSSSGRSQNFISLENIYMQSGTAMFVLQCRPEGTNDIDAWFQPRPGFRLMFTETGFDWEKGSIIGADPPSFLPDPKAKVGHGITGTFSVTDSCGEVVRNEAQIQGLQERDERHRDMGKQPSNNLRQCPLSRFEILPHEVPVKSDHWHRDRDENLKDMAKRWIGKADEALTNWTGAKDYALKDHLKSRTQLYFHGLYEGHGDVGDEIFLTNYVPTKVANRPVKMHQTFEVDIYTPYGALNGDYTRYWLRTNEAYLRKDTQAVAKRIGINVIPCDVLVELKFEFYFESVDGHRKTDKTTGATQVDANLKKAKGDLGDIKCVCARPLKVCPLYNDGVPVLESEMEQPLYSKVPLCALIRLIGHVNPDQPGMEGFRHLYGISDGHSGRSILTFNDITQFAAVQAERDVGFSREGPPNMQVWQNLLQFISTFKKAQLRKRITAITEAAIAQIQTLGDQAPPMYT